MTNPAYITESNATLLKNVAKGEFVRLNDHTESTWVRGGYIAACKAYELHHAEDMNRTTVRRGTSTVYVGFTY